MMRKRVAAAFAALLLGLVCFSGCEGGLDRLLDPKSPAVVTVWHYYNGPQRDAFDRLVTEFNETVGAEKGVSVQHVSKGGKVNDLIQAIKDSASHAVGADELPSMFAAYADTAYQIDRLGLVAGLDKYFTEEELSEYVAGYLDEGRFDATGALKIFPTAKSSEILMLNKTDWDKFAAADPTVSLDDLATYEGIVSVAEKYYNWTERVYGEGRAFFGRDVMANYFIIGAKQLGVELFSVEKGEVTYRLDEAVLRKLWDCFYVPFVNGWFAANGNFRSDDMKLGKIAAMVCSTSGATYFPKEVTVSDDVKYPVECLPLTPPVFEGGEKVAVQQGAGMAVTKTDEKTQYACTVFLKWFTEAERNIEFSVGSGYLPVKAAANDVETITSVAEARGMAFNDVVQQSLPVSVQTVREYSLYTNKAFEGGTEARDVLENSLFALAKADNARVEALVEAGARRSAAVEQLGLLSNAYFKAWYDSISGELTAL